LRALLGATIALGVAFLAIKGVEYAHEYHEGLVPGAYFRYEGAHALGVELFMTLYFVATGMHAVHMLIGIAVFGILLARTRGGRYSHEGSTGIEVAGLYWHFVDIVWIFLFPCLYLLTA